LQQSGKLKHPVERALADSFDPATLLGMILVAVVVAPLVEEFCFRAVLQGWLEKFWAAATSAPIEALPADASPAPQAESPESLASQPLAPATDDPAPWNPYEPPRVADAVCEQPAATMWFPIAATSLIFALLHATAWPAPVPLFFLSLGLGYLYQRTHRLAPSIVMHATVNGVSVLMLAVQPFLQGG
jgi:membrane protease YdiL (CAAX protease family)